ncbi:alpha/beta fold hydrolase [Corynebacterium callunae]|uniref:alpha/beta fold hydrolase n=1 Tax=Corynebacterium callunae TaxID=1721 RepID=UPI0039822304
MSVTSVTVTCPAGQITGEPHLFRSIPYAHAESFADACKLEPGTIDARTAAERLHLTVATPEARFGADFPVIVFIHGGSYEAGTRFDPRTAPEFFVERGFVVVLVDYRLGVEGFVRFHDDEPNHYRGIDDCGLALEWVQKNIEFFGGDPTNVTLIGQSAGAGIALWLARLDHYKGAFRRLVALSPGFPRQPFQARKGALRRSLGKPITRTALAKMNPEKLAKGYARFRRRFFNDLALGPFPYDPAEMAELDFIISATRDEMYNHPVGKRLDQRGFGLGLIMRLLGIKNIRPYLAAARSIDNRVVGRAIGDAMIRRFVAQTEKGWWIEFPGRHCEDLIWIFREDSQAHHIIADFARGKKPFWPLYDPTTRQALSLVEGNPVVVRDPLRMVREAF